MTTILVVDDDANLVCVLERQLKTLGEVRKAYNLAEALEQMRKLPPPDLVLLDLFFPTSSLEETLHHISALKQVNPNAIVIVITGSNEERLEEMARKMGADSFARKTQIATSARLYRAVYDAYLSKGMGGQDLLDRLNACLSPSETATP